MTQRVRFFVLLFLSFAWSYAGLAATWYVRADGGTRYSANAQLGQCDGSGRLQRTPALALTSTARLGIIGFCGMTRVMETLPG